MNLEAIDQNLTLLQGMLEQWLSFRKYIDRSFDDTPASAEEETGFLEIKSSISRSSRTVAEKIKSVGKMDFGEKVLRESLTKCVSVDHMKKLPLSDKRSLVKDWHGVFIKLSRSVGALKMMSEGYLPLDPAKSGKKKSKKGMGKPMLIVIVLIVLAVLGGGIYFLMENVL